MNGDSDNLELTYGLILTQQVSGTDTFIFLTSLYFDSDLVNQKLLIFLHILILTIYLIPSYDDH